MALFRKTSHELFSDEHEIMQECVKCGESKPITEFTLRDRHNRIDDRCRSCKKKASKIVRKLKKENKHLNFGICHCCGKTKESRSSSVIMIISLINLEDGFVLLATPA